MKSLPQFIFTCVLGLSIPATTVFAHEAGHQHIHAEKTEILPLPMLLEKSGPVRKPKLSSETKVSGQGFWKFAPVPNVLPIPEEAKPFVKGAHGTLIVDAQRDILYWGLQKVGWISYTEKLTQGNIIKGDAALASGNLHGADLFYRKGKAPLVVVADDAESEVYLSDTTFQKAQKLPWPEGGPYTNKNQFHPTDAAFTSEGQFYVTDGYGKAYFMPGTIDPLKYDGVYIGGKEMSQTPHGITYKKDDNSLLISARAEGQVKKMNLKDNKFLETLGLPPGSSVCDVDIWGDYALAPCLNGPDKTPGPIYIINLKKKAIVSVIKPKEDLGFTEAQHMHDATWYFVGTGRQKEVYIIFTNWNPGGIGALKLVNQPD